jgi:hypothetical protein
MPQDQPKPAAPYLPWKTFLSSLDVFTEGIPPVISRGVWRQSGLVQGQIMGAYRFFALVDGNDKPTELLEVLVESGGDQRPETVRDLLKVCYPEVLAHDLKTMTFDMLDDLIEKYNVSGATKKKAITFFLQAAKYAGLPLSTFIQVRNTGPRRRRIPRNGESPYEELPPIKQTNGGEQVVELNSGGSLTLTVAVDFLALSESDRKFVFDVVDKLKGYMHVKQVSAGKGAA